jgi:hypothetical protein
VLDRLVFFPALNILGFPSRVHQVPLVDVVFHLNKKKSKVIEGEVVQDVVLLLLLHNQLFVGFLQAGEVESESKCVEKPSKELETFPLRQVLDLWDVGILLPGIPNFQLEVGEGMILTRFGLKVLIELEVPLASDGVNGETEEI